MTDPQTSMLVVLDADSDSLAPLSAAQKYASHTVVLRSWAADTPENTTHVESSASAEPTISEALKLAAERGIKWVGVRRSFLPPQEMLGELLSATAQHATEATPGFAVLLTNGNHGPLQRILAIVNRSDGPVSGLAVYAAVAVADVAGAQLDILVIGSEDENPHTEDELDILVINRERELFDAAIARAEDRDVRVNWITAASVTDLWPVVADQLTQHDYDLVIDDLGNVSLAKVRRRASIQEALAAGSVGALPLKLLAETSVPVLLVIDEIRIRWAPPRALRAGAAAITLGVVTGPIAAAAAAPPATVATMRDEDPAVDLIRQLNLALSQAEQEAGAQDSAAAEEQRTADAGAASRGAGGEGARSGAAASVQATVPVMDFPATQYGAADYAAAMPAAGVAQPTGYVPDVEPTVVAEEATSKTSAKSSDAKAKEKKSGSAKKDSRTKAPKGGATPTQVAKAKNAAARDKAALEKAKKQKEKSAETVAELEDKIVEAADDAAKALAALEAASQSHAEATKAAEETAAASTGVAAVLPSAPTELEVTSAALNEQVATQRLEAALSTGEESLETLESTDQALEDHQEKLADRRAAVQESRAGLEKSKDKAEAYQASLAKTRQSPVSKGRYNLTARYGSGGGYWSSGIHTGLDFAAPSGTPVMAAASGTVVSTGYEGAYGNRVVIRHGNGVMTTYNHLSSVSVSPGTKVSTGDQIGRVGTTGNTTGSHLHFEVTQNDRFVNPEAWLGW